MKFAKLIDYKDTQILAKRGYDPEKDEYYTEIITEVDELEVTAKISGYSSGKATQKVIDTITDNNMIEAIESFIKTTGL